MTHSNVIIRKALHQDHQRIRDLCALTGNDGKAIDKSRWNFFSEQWVGPYIKLLPEWIYVAEMNGTVCGYLTGCPHDSSFAVSRFTRHTIPLIVKILAGKYKKNNDTKRFITRSLGIDEKPEQMFSTQTQKTLRDHYPAHLHINLDETTRGMGIGAKLIDAFKADLAPEGKQGIHVFCGKGPKPFYMKNGFVEIDAVEFKPGVTVFAMGLALQ